jgi:hypothetical protein
MLEADPFLLSQSEIATTEAMRAEGAIPGDWRYIDIPWQHAAIFDAIVEIGGDDLRVLSSSARGEQKRGGIVFGPEASKRINERASEIHVLFDAYRIDASAAARQEAA